MAGKTLGRAVPEFREPLSGNTSDALETAWFAWFGKQAHNLQLDPRLVYAAGWCDGTRFTVAAMSTISDLVPALRGLADVLEAQQLDV